MTMTPEELKERNKKNLEKARAVRDENRRKKEAEIAAGTYVAPPAKARRPRNLAKIVRELLEDEELLDQMMPNQPEMWSLLPNKNAGAIIGWVMATKAMQGNIDAANWVRKTAYGDKVLLETEDGFFQKTEFNIQVVPPKKIDESVEAEDLKQTEE